MPKKVPTMQTHEDDGFALYCDDPACPCRYAKSADTTLQDVRALSAGDGWTTTGATDFCPDHTGEAAPPLVLGEPEEVSLTAEQYTPAIPPVAPAEAAPAPPVPTPAPIAVPTTVSTTE